MEWKQRHILDLDTWDRSELRYILEQTRSMDELLDRPIKKVPAPGKLVVNLFSSLPPGLGFLSNWPKNS